MFGFSYKSAGYLVDFLREKMALSFDTLADMRGSIYVQAGMTVYTLGYTSVGDGGGCKYKIRARTSSDVDNGATKIICGRAGSWSNYKPAYVAEPVIDTPFLDVRKFGMLDHVVAYDDISRMGICLSFCKSHNMYLLVQTEYNYELARKVIASNSTYSGINVSYNGGYMQSSKLSNLFNWDYEPGRICSIKESVTEYNDGGTITVNEYIPYHKDFDIHTLTSTGTYSNPERLSTKISTGTTGLKLPTDICALRVVDVSAARKLVLTARAYSSFCFVVFPMNSSKQLMTADYNKVKYTCKGVTEYMEPSISESEGNTTILNSYYTNTWSSYSMATIDILDSNIKFVAVGVCGKASGTLLYKFSIDAVYKLGEFGDSILSGGVPYTMKLQSDINQVVVTDKTKLDSDGPAGEIIYTKPDNLSSSTGTGSIVIGYMKKTTAPTWLTLSCDYSDS